MSAFTALPRRSVRRPVRPGSSHLALDLWVDGSVALAPAPAPVVAPAPVLRLVPALPSDLPVSAPAPSPAADDSLVDLAAGDGVFRVDVVLADGSRESVVGSAPSARVARADAADDGVVPVAVWAVVGSGELLVWGSAA